MFNPAVANFITQFYPLGNTPAVNLTKCFPQGLDADILLLGCGDVRNVLFTAYCDQNLPSRKLDFTCCDIQESIIARNIVLLSLFIDDESDINPKIAWSIYYDLYLDNATAKLIQAHVEKLLSLSTSLEQWRNSKYGSMLAFCDETTFVLVRKIWSKYATPSSSQAAFNTELQRSKDMMRATVGSADGPNLTGMRSAAPFSLVAGQEVPKAVEHFWKHGSLSKSVGDIPNPMFSSTLSPNTLLHYATDPLLGFHLATAFASLAPLSPLRPDTKDDNSVFVVATAARTQFSEWTRAFRSISKRGLKLRFVVADALTFCHALQCGDGAASSTNLYRRQFDTSVCDIDPQEYGSPQAAPRSFDVIDTSNLSNHFGALNYLIAAAPLLKDIASSTLYLESLVKKDETRQEGFDRLLCGHAPTVSLLLGVTAVEQWTNATSVNYVDEMLMTLTAAKHNTQAHSRISWKLNHHLHGQTRHHGLVHMDPEAVVQILFQIYLQMFDYENFLGLSAMSPEQRIQVAKNGMYPPFHRGSLVTLMKRAQTTINTDWAKVSQKLITSISQDQTLSFGSNHIQELHLHLHMRGLYSEGWLSNDIHRASGLGSFNEWQNIPEVVALTLVVPRKCLDAVFGADPMNVSAPTLHCILASGVGTWRNYYADLHIAFGTIKTSSQPDKDDFTIIVAQDADSWRGTSPVIISFYVPSAALQAEPNTAKVGLGILPTVQNVAVFGSRLGMKLSMYETTLSDSSHVFVTKHLPGMNGFPLIGLCRSPATPEAGADTTNISITANTDETAKTTTLTGHADILSEKGKALLVDKAPITLRQTSSFTIDIVFGMEALVCPVTFPLPISSEGSKTRIARKSSYVEVIARLADPLTSESLSDFIFPCVLGPGGTPLSLNSDHLDLDTLPILNLESANKEKMEFLSPLASHQFSVRERRIREGGQKTAQGITTNLRLNFKESLLTIFMLASGLQGGQTGLFALQHPDLGVAMLLLVRAIRLDGAAGSVVADAAILNLTVDLVKSPKMQSFLLVLRDLQACAIKVDDAELRLWKRMLPALVERCRTWTHKPSCEYKKRGATIPLSLDPVKQCICNCGNGKLPDNFMTLPDWDVASKYAVRIALSLTFSVPFVEDIVDVDMFKGISSLGDSLGSMAIDRCRNCSKTTTPSGGKLMPCSRCKEVKYCSKECQKADWKKHRMECSSD